MVKEEIYPLFLFKLQKQCKLKYAEYAFLPSFIFFFSEECRRALLSMFVLKSL